VRRLTLLAVLAALVVPAVAAAFANTEPYAAQEWYLDQDQAWSFWPTMPSLTPVKVAIIDSGIDGTHPDLAGRVVAARSFVGGSPYRDEQGHGTFVAGEIAANPTNAVGMAGLAFNARLIVAKVVAADGEVSLPAEVAGIRWAVDEGARVVNLSLGGVRDPLNPSLDTYSPLERAAVEYAYSKGAVVVAAVGNGTQSPSMPWRYAAYPAALPHVIGVSAVRRNGSVPDYSNRDAVYVDVAAPGADMFSTIPANLVADDSGCTDPYSDCGPLELRDAIGTSFAAPQVSAAAALILGIDPSLTPDQVAYVIERSADDASTLYGCGA
jgi:subtilisin family serine protease